MDVPAPVETPPEKIVRDVRINEKIGEDYCWMCSKQRKLVKAEVIETRPTGKGNRTKKWGYCRDHYYEMEEIRGTDAEICRELGQIEIREVTL